MLLKMRVVYGVLCSDLKPLFKQKIMGMDEGEVVTVEPSFAS